MEEIKAHDLQKSPQQLILRLILNKGQRRTLSPLTINSKCFEDVLNTPTRPKTRTVGQEEATTPQTIARSTSIPEWLVDAFNMAPTPKLETPTKLMNSPTRRRLADISNTPTTPSAKRVKLFTEALPVINVIMI
jgi:hypothetical protein